MSRPDSRSLSHIVWNARFSEAQFQTALELFHEGQYRECIEYLNTALEASKANAEFQSQFSIGSAYVLLCRCFLQADRHDECLQLYEWIGESIDEGVEKFILDALVDSTRGSFASVELRCGAFLQRARSNVVVGVADVMLLHASAQMNLGYYERALESVESCAAFYRVFGIRANVARSISMKGLICRKLGRIRESSEWFRKAARVNREYGFQRSACDNTLNVGVNEYRLGLVVSSQAILSGVLEQYRLHDSRANICRTHIALGNVHGLLRSFSDARNHLTQAYAMATDLRIPREECLALEFLGDVFRDDGKPGDARRYYARGMAIAVVIAPEGDLVMELRRREGECLVLEGQVASALLVLAEARRHAAKLGDRFEEGVTVRCLAEAMLAIKDHAGAQRYAEEACEILGAVEARLEQLAARIVAVNALLGRSENLNDETLPRDLLDFAWDHALIAQSLVREIDVEYWINAVKRLQSRIAKRRIEEARYAVPALRQTGDTYGGKGVIIAESRAMKEVLQAIEAFAPYDEALLITGETGTGKELVAQRVHEMSTRRGGNFVAVNVTAVPTSMFEREFFGHRRGAFSGADNDCEGYAAEANGGTLFLDEIGDMAKETQAKLLRLLQDGSYTVLGNPDERRTDLRVVAATNKNLEQAVIDGKFREDLYYRLCILEINIPPLRKHTEDIVPLLEHFLSQSAGRRVAATDFFNRTSLNLLQHYPWPGNAREVSMVARRAHISLKIDGKVLVEFGSGRDALVLSGPGKEAAAAAAAGSADDANDLSRARLVLALEEAGGNRTEAARLLGISRGALYRRLERFGLE